MRGLVRSTALLGAGSAATVVAALLRAKVLAAWLGPQGTGVMAQLSTLTAVLVPLATLGIGNGVVALIAEARGKGDLARVGRIERTAHSLTWGIGGSLAVITALASPWLAPAILEGRAYAWVVVVGAACVPLSAVASLRISMLQGHEAIRSMAGLNAAIAGVGVASILPLAWFLGLTGAVIQLLVVALAYVWLSGRALEPHARSARAAEDVGAGRADGPPAAAAPARPPRIDRALLPPLLRYGGSALLVGLSSTLTLLVLRSILVKRLGLAENGIYQVCVGVSGLYMPLILNSITATVWPQIAAERDNARVVETMQQAARLAFLLMTGVAASVMVAAPVAIPVLYSSRFLPALSLLPLQFVGDYFRTGAWMFGVWLVPRNRLRPWVLFDVIYGLVLLAVFLLLVGRVGTRSVVLAYVAAHVSHSVLHYLLARRSIGFRLGAANRRLLLGSAALLLGLAAWTPHDPRGSALALLAACGWAGLVVRPREWRAAWNRGRALLPGAR